MSKTEETDREKEQEKEFKVKVEEKITEKPREKSRRSDDSSRTRDSGEHRDREWDSERTVKTESERSSRSEHRSRHDGERSKSDADRIRSESDRFKGDSDRSRSESDRERTRIDSDRKRGDVDRVKSERSESDRARGDSDRTRGDSDRTKSDSDRVRNDGERTRGERSERSESDRTRSDSDRLKSEADHVRSETERQRTDDRKDRSRSDRDRDRDRERRSERSDRKGRSKERDRNSSYSERDRSRERSRDRPREKERAKEQRESSRRPRTPPEDKKAPEVPPPSAPSPPPAVLTPPAPAKKDDQAFECFSPGVEMEAISDDEMPEMDHAPGNENEDELDVEPNGAEAEPHDKKADSTVGDDADSAMQDAEAPVAPSAEGALEADEPEEFEEILSDEDLMFDDYGNDMAELDALELPELADIGKPVNPYAVELQPLQHFTDPSLTAYQRLTRAADRSLEPEEAASRLRPVLEINSRGEKWLDSISQVIGVLPSALAYLKCQGSFEEVDAIQTKVIEWLVHGLDFDRALEQVGPSTLTVRHIKTGLKLVHAVAQSSPVLLQRAVDEGAMAKILSLYAAPHMALSLKLMCLRSLDALLAWPYAMERWRREPISPDGGNGYERLVEMIEAAQPSRAQVSLAALVRKVNLYASLERVHEIGHTLARLPGQRKTNSREQLDPTEMDDATEASSSDALEPLSAEILARLSEIRQVYLNPRLSIGHFERFLPVHRQFEIAVSGSGSDPLLSVYSFMRHHRFLHVLLLLLTHPSTASNPAILDRVLSFLEEFRRTQHGLCFMAAQPDVTSLILRVLLHSGVQQGQHAPDSAADSRQDDYANTDETNVTGSPSSLHRLGLQLAYALHALSCLDALNYQAVTHGKERALHMIEPIQSLHSMVFNATSRLALIHVLGLDSNLDVLATYVTSDSDPELESRLKESAMRAYAIELVALVARFTENASFYAKYGATLHELATANQDESSKLSQLTRWVEVVNQAPVFTLDGGLPALCDVVKQHADEAANFPPELIVALRLVCPLAIENADREVPRHFESALFCSHSSELG